MNSVIWITTLIGALIGLSPVINSTASTMIVGSVVGAGFGVPVGAAISFLLMAAKKKLGNGSNLGTGGNEIGHPNFPLMAADEWAEYRQKFPFFGAGDTDPVAKTMTGWRDASDIQYTRDIAS